MDKFYWPILWVAGSVLLLGISAILTSIWYRLGAVKEIKESLVNMNKKFDLWRDKAYETFKSKKECELERKACSNAQSQQ